MICVVMARPRTYQEPRLATAVRLPESIHLRLRTEAASRQVSANLLVERAIVAYLNRLPSLEAAIGVEE